jgi:hypothetical protein
MHSSLTGPGATKVFLFQILGGRSVTPPSFSLAFRQSLGGLEICQASTLRKERGDTPVTLT